jgi:hypothetical protein
MRNYEPAAESEKTINRREILWNTNTLKKYSQNRIIYSTGEDAEILIIIDLQNVKMVNIVNFLSITNFRSRLNYELQITSPFFTILYSLSSVPCFLFHATIMSSSCVGLFALLMLRRFYHTVVLVPRTFLLLFSIHYSLFSFLLSPFSVFRSSNKKER